MKNWENSHERFKNLPEGEKQKLVKYKKNIIKWEKKCLTVIIRNYCFKK